jgi:hypothetical protein
MMSAQYSVIRYVPDPIAEECVNFGVVTWDQERIRCRFLTNWTRVRSFGHENVNFLREFAREMVEVTSQQLPLEGINAVSTLNEDQLKKMMSGWGENIQFSSPRGSTKDAVALIADIGPLFLRAQRPARSKVRTRVTAARVAANILLDAVRQRAPDEAERLVKRKEVVDGAIEQHKLDVALLNGHLIAGVQAISFEINAGEHLEKEMLSIKWAISDIRQSNRELPMAIFAFPPRRGGGARSAYRDARRVFPALHADMVTSEQHMEQWASEKVQAIPLRHN